MVVRLFNLDKWNTLSPGQCIALAGEKPRTIRISFNTAEPARVDCLIDGERFLLGTVDGLETFEFFAGGNLIVAVDTDADVFWFTEDGAIHAIENPEAVSFTELTMRRERNREAELVMHKMEQNMSRRMAQVERAISQKLALLEKVTDDTAKNSPAAAPVHDAGKTGKPDGGSQPPAKKDNGPAGSPDTGPSPSGSGDGNSK